MSYFKGQGTQLQHLLKGEGSTRNAQQKCTGASKVNKEEMSLSSGHFETVSPLFAEWSTRYCYEVLLVTLERPCLIRFKRVISLWQATDTPNSVRTS